jgi:AcrR family transcriptional regulator
VARPSVFTPQTILEATAQVASAQGPNAATIAAIAQRLGGPTGSIYHRFSSREVLLAELWLHTLESFEGGFVEAFSVGDPIGRGLTAALYTPQWARREPVLARLLMLHHKDDFLRGDWPSTLVDRASALGVGVDREYRRFARDVFGSAAADAMRRARFAVTDIPYAAVRRHLRADEPPPKILDELIETSYRALIGSA